MASTSETGHAKNIANAKLLNEKNAANGKYNPEKPALKTPAMVAQQAACDLLQKDVNKQLGILKPVDNTRRQVFAPVKKLARRTRAAGKISGAKADFNKNLNTIVVKILGERLSAAKGTDSDSAGTSASQQSFDMMIDHVDVMIGLLETEPLYAPNEVDITTAAWKTLRTAMITANDAAKAAQSPYDNARIARNLAVYGRTKGLVQNCMDSKDATKIANGFNSEEYKLVTKIKFKMFMTIEDEV